MAIDCRAYFVAQSVFAHTFQHDVALTSDGDVACQWLNGGAASARLVQRAGVVGYALQVGALESMSAEDLQIRSPTEFTDSLKIPVVDGLANIPAAAADQDGKVMLAKGVGITDANRLWFFVDGKRYYTGLTEG